jgi:hypothetical protein
MLSNTWRKYLKRWPTGKWSLSYKLLGRMRLSQRMDAKMITRFKVHPFLRNYREMVFRIRVSCFALAWLTTEVKNIYTIEKWLLSPRMHALQPPGRRCWMRSIARTHLRGPYSISFFLSYSFQCLLEHLQPRPPKRSSNGAGSSIWGTCFFRAAFGGQRFPAASPKRCPQNRNSNSSHSKETVPVQVVAIEVATIKVLDAR